MHTYQITDTITGTFYGFIRSVVTRTTTITADSMICTSTICDTRWA